MARQELETQIISIIEGELGLEDTPNLDDTLIEDLSADSLDLVNLVLQMEEAFAITIPDEDVPALKTVGDIINYIEKRAVS